MVDIIIYTKHPEMITNIIEALLEKKVAVRIVSSNSEAINEVDREAPNAILFDFDACTTGSFDSFKHSARKISGILPIIGYGYEWREKEPHGADLYLRHPFSVTELMLVLNTKTAAHVQ